MTNVPQNTHNNGPRGTGEAAETRSGGMNRRRLLGVAASVAGLAALGDGPATAATFSTAQPTRSSDSAGRKRVVVIVVDGLNRDLVRRYNMDHIAAVMQDGVDFPNSYLGHLGALTVVTHNVITSGRLPKNMGWTDEGFRDVHGILKPLSDEPDNPFWVTSSFSAEQMFALMKHAGYPKLSDYLHTALPGTTVATVSPKTYAGYAFGGPTSDIIVTFSGRDFDCDGDGKHNWRGPAGVNVPSYLTEPACGRYYVDSAKDLTYDTHLSPARMYPLDGNRYVVGRDPAHEGGDIWAADTAIDIMRNENWSGLFVTLPGVDKAAHMWGSIDDRPPFADPMTHMPEAARVADEQVGRIIGELEDSGLLDETLVVLTSDHGFLPARRHHGLDDGTETRGYYNWYYGDTANGDYLDPAPALEPLVGTGNVGMSYQDSAIRAWLKDPSEANMREAGEAVAGMPDVIAAYHRVGDRYRRTYRAGRQEMSAREWSWYRRHGQELVDTQAAAYGPDVIGLLRDNVSFGVAGDHGGAQHPVQDIPIVFYGGGLSAARSGAPIRSVDIMPTVLRALGIPATAPHDGTAYPLPGSAGQ